jgi:hypothetical protein
MKRNDKQRTEQHSALFQKLLAQGGEIKLTQNINGNVKEGTVTTEYDANSNGQLEAITTVTDKNVKSRTFTTPEESPGVVTVNISTPKILKR